VGLQRISNRDIKSVGCASRSAIPVTVHGSQTDYDVVKLALTSLDQVILRSLLQQTIQYTPDADWSRPDLLIRARDLLAEFYLIQGNGHGRELGNS
jgi:hypothetical protein